MTMPSSHNCRIASVSPRSQASVAASIRQSADPAAGYCAAVSQESLEVIRRAYEALERGELPFDCVHPEVRIYNIPDSPVPGPYYGHEGLRRWRDEISEVIPGFRLVLKELIEVGDERIVATHRMIGRAAHTDIDVDAGIWAGAYWMRDDKAIRICGYLTKEQAIEAASLRSGDAEVDPEQQ